LDVTRAGLTATGIRDIVRVHNVFMTGSIDANRVAVCCPDPEPVIQSMESEMAKKSKKSKKEKALKKEIKSRKAKISKQESKLKKLKKKLKKAS
jgi:hypothetical protein